MRKVGHAIRRILRAQLRIERYPLPDVHVLEVDLHVVIVQPDRKRRVRDGDDIGQAGRFALKVRIVSQRDIVGNGGVFFGAIGLRRQVGAGLTFTFN